MMNRKLQFDYQQITLPDGRLCQFNVKIHARAKRLSMRVVTQPFPHIQVTKPRFCSQKLTIQFIESQQEWVMNMLPHPHRFADGQIFSYRGKNCMIKWLGDADRSRAQYEEGAEQDMLYVLGSEITCAETVKRWLKACADKHLAERVRFYANLQDQEVKQVKIIDYQSLWGRCNQKKRFISAGG